MPKKIQKPSVQGLWFDRVNPPLDEIDAIMKKYDFHELDRDAILESNQYARLDAYDEYIFLVLHFPKYDANSDIINHLQGKKYMKNMKMMSKIIL